MKYEFPDDLLKMQADMVQVRAELHDVLAALPYSVEPLEAWRRPENYWRDASPARDESPGWTEREQQQVTALRGREVGLAEAIVTHSFWGQLSPDERPAARDALKHAAEPGPGESEA
ncbi:hypothetical protein [Streptomyces sp. NPDC058045]|uniref:hypothetical protein n=1 Tax=Streptomyces sp. NPDC058045 TaxID=3346311 RepID=UPI0036E17BA3